MTQWIIVAALLTAAWFILPMQSRSIRRWRKGRAGGIGASFATGLAEALDPARRIIVEEMEKRQDMDGEEADGDDEPLTGAPDRVARPSSHHAEPLDGTGSA